MKRLIAAVLIAVSALAASGFVNASAEPRGEWRGRQRRSRRGRGHDYRPENPIPGILGGILGGWLAEQLRPDEPEQPYRDEELEDDTERDGRPRG